MTPLRDPEVNAYLDEIRIPIRIACATASGWPSLVSLWFLRDGDRLLCATPADARVVGWLAAEPRCGFEVSGNDMPYRGVRGRARARIDREGGAEVLRRLALRYLGSDATPFARWLLSRPEPEVAIALEIEQLTHWDFSKRMQAS